MLWRTFCGAAIFYQLWRAPLISHDAHDPVRTVHSSRQTPLRSFEPVSQTETIVPGHPPTSTAAIGVEKQATNTATHVTVPTDRILVTCPYCATILSVRRVYIGDGVRCKQCTQKFLVPAVQGDRPIAIYDCSARDASTESHRSEVVQNRHRPDSEHASLMTQLAQFIASHDQLRSDHDRLRAEFDGIRLARDTLAEQLRAREVELCSVRTNGDALTRSLAEDRAALAAATAQIAQLKQQLAEGARAIAAKLDESHTELERCRGALCSSERPRHSEVEQLTVELTSLKHQHELLIEQHQAAGSLFASLQAQNEELSAAQEQLAAEYQKQIENEKLARAQLATELFHLRAESDEMARLAEQWISAAMPVPTVPFASGEELEPGQIPIEALGRGIAESGYLERLLAETLEKSGGRTHRSRDGQGSTQPAALGQT
jgi:hypothetical protein